MPTQQSLEYYEKTYKKLVRDSGEMASNEEILAHIVNKDVKTTTKCNMLNAVIALAKLGKTYDADVETMKQQRDEYQKTINKGVKSDKLGKYREKIESTSMEQINSLLEKLGENRHESTEAMEDFLMLWFMIPPLRNDLQEISLCRNYKARGKSNCIYIPKDKSKLAELRINEHKTTTRGGKPIVKKIPNDIREDIENLFSDGRPFLFSTKNGKAYTSSGFSKLFSDMMKRYLDIALSSTALRKLYLSSKYSGIREEMRRDSEMMGHSQNVQQSHYIDDNFKKTD